MELSAVKPFLAAATGIGLGVAGVALGNEGLKHLASPDILERAAGFAALWGGGLTILGGALCASEVRTSWRRESDERIAAHKARAPRTSHLGL